MARQDNLVCEKILGNFLGLEKSKKDGDIKIRWIDKTSNKKYDTTLSLFKDLISGKNFNELYPDILKSNFNKYDFITAQKEETMQELKSSNENPKIGTTILLCEPHKLSEGYEKDIKRIQRFGLSPDEYNTGCKLYCDLLNHYKINELIILRKLLFMNKKTGDIFDIFKFKILPAEISKGRLKRVVIKIKILDFSIHSTVPQELLQTVDFPTEIKKSSKTRVEFDYLEKIKSFIDNNSHITNLCKHLTETHNLYEFEKLPERVKKEKRYHEVIVNGEKLYLHTKDDNKTKKKKLKNLETSIKYREMLSEVNISPEW